MRQPPPVGDARSGTLPTVDGEVVAGFELGGTKCVGVLARGPRILKRVEVTTRDAVGTLGDLAGWLRACLTAGVRPRAIGIASFGPICLDPDRPGWGIVSSTPKPGWDGADVAAPFGAVLDVPVAIDTDVAAAALAECVWGGAREAARCAYVTIGTGVGVGLALRDGDRCSTLATEFGHLRIRHNGRAAFPGTCPYRGDCAEGLISGPAIALRTGSPAEGLDPGHAVWTSVAAEAAEVIAATFLAYAPDTLIIGGGVGLSSAFPRAAAVVTARTLLASYLHPGDLPVAWASFGADTGPIGAAALASQLLRRPARAASDPGLLPLAYRPLL